jgi:predicted nucleic acid-binding protein
MGAVYLLDTALLLHWTRGSKQAQAVEQQFQLSTSPFRPLICEVSIGEMRAFAKSLGWGPKRLTQLREVELKVVRVDISDDRVLDAYAELSTLAKDSGWGLFSQKNDLWVGAAAHATGSHLLTMDKDFLPLRGRSGWLVTVLDSRSGFPLP